MTDQSDVFKQTTPQTETPSTTTSSDNAYADLLSGIKNEEGNVKYDSVTKALEGLQNAQSYIPDLKGQLKSKDDELATLKAELDKRSSVEDVVSRLTGDQSQGNPQPEGTPPVVGVDEAKVTELFQSLLSKQQNEASQQDNRQRVNSALAQAYGEKAADVIAEKATQLGMTPAELGEMSSNKPEVVLALFNQQAAKVAGPTTSSVNIPPINVQQPTLEPPTKSLLVGASTREQKEYLQKVRASVYAKHGITN